VWQRVLMLMPPPRRALQVRARCQWLSGVTAAQGVHRTAAR